MSEMSETADRLIVVGRGRLIAEGTVEDVVQGSTSGHVRVDSAEPDRLRRLLCERDATASHDAEGVLVVTGMDARNVGIVAGEAGITLYELSSHWASLEDAYSELTRDAVEYSTRGAAA